MAMIHNDKYLRLVSLEDTEKVHDLLCVPEVYRYLADNMAPDLSITHGWIERSAGDADRYGGGLWMLECPTRQKILGLTRLSDFADYELQLTYLLHPSIWGHGYATRMAHTVMHHAFQVGIAIIIWAGADVANAASVSVMQNLGMRFLRNVDYPAGSGVEYVMAAGSFNPDRAELLSIVGQWDLAQKRTCTI